MAFLHKLGKFRRVFGNIRFYKNLPYNISHYQRLNQPPVILCGCPRSGTTLLMSMLDSHPQLHVIPFETVVFQYRKLIDRVFKSRSMHQWLQKLQLISYLFSSRIKPSANRWCEKTPLNILNVNEINELFNGRVQFINIVRDGRAVVSSKHSRYGYMVKPELWYRCINSGINHKAMPNFYTVRFEDLVQNPVETLKGIKQFLKLENDFSEHWYAQTSIKGEIISLVNGLSEGSAITKQIDPASLFSWKKSDSPWLSEFMDSSKYMEMNSNLGYKTD